MSTSLMTGGPEFGLIIADGTTWLGEVDVYESAQIIARYNDITTWELVVPSSSRPRPGSSSKRPDPG